MGKAARDQEPNTREAPCQVVSKLLRPWFLLTSHSSPHLMSLPLIDITLFQIFYVGGDEKGLRFRRPQDQTGKNFAGAERLEERPFAPTGSAMGPHLEGSEK